MDKPVIYIIFLFWFFCSKAQENLVPNGSFEEYNNCPSFAEGFYINACKNWGSPTLASPDYLNSCSIDFDSSLNQYYFSVPQNGYGHQDAKDGNAYAFISFGQNNANSQPYSEYIQVKLKQKLTIGKCYEVKFYVHNPLNTCVNTIGVLLSPTELSYNHDSIIQLNPDFETDSNIFFCDTNNWTELSFNFSSKSDDEFLIIGIFKQMNEIKMVDFAGQEVAENVDAYFYIDQVSLIEIECNLPNVFSPNNDGINDVLDLNLQMGEISSVVILNRWGENIFTSNSKYSWDGLTNQGQYCGEGTYFLIVEYKNKTKKTGFIHLVR